ncbi:MAG TPA: YdeI/OmpD-associated family protein [Acidimicrobiales bacterium]|nr:YdeI/OmpD-associated family protein [Acidimicrobiales bacterium]
MTKAVVEYSTTLAVGPSRRVYVPVPFDPDEQWGHKSEHHLSGTVGGCDVRGVVEHFAGEPGIVLGPAWRRDRGLAAGDAVEVRLKPEGLQRTDLAPDIAAALTANPAAGEFFDGLAQFYRTAYIRWITATKRKPDQRPIRLAEVVRLLEAGIKERPKS